MKPGAPDPAIPFGIGLLLFSPSRVSAIIDESIILKQEGRSQVKKTLFRTKGNEKGSVTTQITASKTFFRSPSTSTAVFSRSLLSIICMDTVGLMTARIVLPPAS